jgi:hypothetical protein
MEMDDESGRFASETKTDVGKFPLFSIIAAAPQFGKRNDIYLSDNSEACRHAAPYMGDSKGQIGIFVRCKRTGRGIEYTRYLGNRSISVISASGFLKCEEIFQWQMQSKT